VTAANRVKEVSAKRHVLSSIVILRYAKSSPVHRPRIQTRDEPLTSPPIHPRNEVQSSCPIGRVFGAKVACQQARLGPDPAEDDRHEQGRLRRCTRHQSIVRAGRFATPTVSRCSTPAISRISTRGLCARLTRRQLAGAQQRLSLAGNQLWQSESMQTPATVASRENAHAFPGALTLAAGPTAYGRRLRLDEIEALPYPIVTVVHSIEAQAHLRISRVMCEMLRSIEASRPRCSRCSSRMSRSSSRIARRTKFGGSSLMRGSWVRSSAGASC
jgi:hypothetical protein